MKKLKIFLVAIQFVCFASSAFCQDNFPKIALMNAVSQNKMSIEQLSKFNLIIDGGMGNNIIENVKKINPGVIVLIADRALYVNDKDPVLTAPGFKEEYLIHFNNKNSDETTSRVKFPGWSYPIYLWNYFNTNAVKYRIDYNISKNKKDLTTKNIYSGIVLDGTHLVPFWMNWYKDSTFNIDGKSYNVKDYAKVQQLWTKNIGDFLRLLKDSLNVMVVCNDFDARFGKSNGLCDYINGVEFETHITSFLDGNSNINWIKDIYDPINNLSSCLQKPQCNIIISLYTSQPVFKLTPSIIEKARQSYNRMRFGLCSALLTGSYYFYWISDANYGINDFWYDEYDNSGKKNTGYLGSPIAPPFQENVNYSPNILKNSNFENGLDGWLLENHTATGNILLDKNSYPGKNSVELQVNQKSQNYKFQFKQTGFSVENESDYTLTFWAKASADRDISVEITRDVADYNAISGYYTVKLTKDWQKYSVNIHIKIPNGLPNPLPARETRMSFFLGDDAPTVWINDVSLQKGNNEPSVFRRDFQNGIVLCNISDKTQNIKLEKTYYHIMGKQDPIINNGKPCNEVILKPKDGLILLNKQD